MCFRWNVELCRLAADYASGQPKPRTGRPRVNVCHVYPYEIADGPANMALDEVLLDVVSAPGKPGAVLRTYGWSEPTLSLGYFQRVAQVRGDSRFGTVAMVRRPTGGGAIWHHHELTYALAVPREHPLAQPSTQLYRAVHAAIMCGLVGFGVRADRRGEVFPPGDCERIRPLLCFTDRSPDDILFEGTKVVGSAQRRREGAVLQQGSLLLARSCQTPELAGLCDVADLSADPREWSDRVAGWIGNAVCRHCVAVRVPEEIRAIAKEREVSRYRDPAWTGIR
jgi:lipoyl(octanoyl) transferase